VSLDDNAAATDEDEDENVLREFGDDRAVIDDRKQHDGVSLRIDDGDVVEPLCKPGEHALVTYTARCARWAGTCYLDSKVGGPLLQPGGRALVTAMWAGSCFLDSKVGGPLLQPGGWAFVT